MAKTLKLIKVTLSTGKIVFLRELKINDTEQAAQMVAKKADGDRNVLQILMQKALLQLVLNSTQEDANSPRKPVSAIDREDLDSLFNLSEYTQLLQVIGKVSGADDTGKEPTIAMEFSE